MFCTLMISKLISVSLLFSVMPLVSCAGSRASVNFERAEFPISMSRAVPDVEGRILSTEDQEVVGHFTASKRGWSVLWTLINLSDIDFSEDVNNQVRSAAGDAIVNVTISAELPTFPDEIPGLFFLHWLPIWPGSVRVDLDGDIVRSAR